MDLYGISAAAIAAAAGVSIRTAARWKRLGIPKRLSTLAALQLNGDLGVVDAAWHGWKLWHGRLWSPEGYAFDAGEIRAIPYRCALVAELEQRLAQPEQLRLL